MMEHDPALRILLLLILTPTLAVALYHRIRAGTGEKLDRRQEGILLGATLRLTGLAAWVVMITWMVNPASMPWSRLDLPAWARWSGAALGVVCPLLLWWVLRALGKNLTDTVVPRTTASLVTGGPYRWVRHPFYGVFLVLTISVSLVAANWLLGAAWLLVYLLLVIRTRKEEAKLVERFGDEYREYMKRTGRFFPALRGRRAAAAAAVVLGTLVPLECRAQSRSLPLDSLDGLRLRHVNAEPMAYKGRKGIRVTEGGAGPSGEEKLVIVAGAEFHNGVIEVDLAGQPGAGAGGQARGFVGVAFRVAPDASRFECIYLRPTNGRADDQVRRNHSVQYVSVPDFPWPRLRKEEPEKYEAYVDLLPGEWTKVKVEVEGVKARLYVHGADQPTLVVNDLKKGESRGAVALWIGPGTEAHFANLRISP